MSEEKILKQALKKDLAERTTPGSVEDALRRALEMTTPEASGTAWSHPDALPRPRDPEFL